ncbi:hypothetical protein [Stenotrophomonas panacihumi]|uniref:hypothetical protein n=1 Tax=Stenotrophomonas panacihumi TaxID=676599 RepID=UPI0011B2038C|nr:hypothetical protein [Stenotrophomonas panacihumi]
MRIVGILLAAISLIVILTALRNGAAVLSLSGTSVKNLEELAQLGDFFGGHFSAFVGSITLLIVLFFFPPRKATGRTLRSAGAACNTAG